MPQLPIPDSNQMHEADTPKGAEHPALAQLRQMQAAYAKVAAKLPKDNPNYKKLTELRAKVDAMIEGAKAVGSKTQEVNHCHGKGKGHPCDGGSAVDTVKQKLSKVAGKVAGKAKAAAKYFKQRGLHLLKDESGSAPISEAAVLAAAVAATQAAHHVVHVLEKHGIAEDEALVNMFHLGEHALHLAAHHWPEILHTAHTAVHLLHPFLEAEIHSAKAHRCVDKVQGKGHDEGSAWAICTSSVGKDKMYSKGHGGSASPKRKLMREVDAEMDAYVETLLAEVNHCHGKAPGHPCEGGGSDGPKFTLRFGPQGPGDPDSSINLGWPIGSKPERRKKDDYRYRTMKVGRRRGDLKPDPIPSW